MNITKTNIVSLSFSEKVSCYAQLFKLRLTSYVVVSAVFGYFIGATTINYASLFWLVIGGFFVTSCSNAFNQIFEKNSDKLMSRTQNRPLPTEKISTTEASVVGLVLGIIGVFILWFALNPLSGILGALAIFSYTVIYTPLKKVSTFSVFVGAFPGAIPPMLGWVAATGTFSLEAGILFALQFLWQFPHFWAIAWRLDNDYKSAGLKMLPFCRKNKTTSVIILVSALLLFTCSFLPEYFHIAGRLATVTLSILALLMVVPSIKLVQTQDDKFALRIMLMSYLYLISSLAILLIDKV
ncbi:MAG: heme o synthase [Vicingaceae bacterium]|nr:heme o synthase [Vicingaceae bacterium]